MPVIFLRSDFVTEPGLKKASAYCNDNDVFECYDQLRQPNGPPELFSLPCIPVFEHTGSGKRKNQPFLCGPPEPQIRHIQGPAGHDPAY